MSSALPDSCCAWIIAAPASIIAATAAFEEAVFGSIFIVRPEPCDGSVDEVGVAPAVWPGALGPPANSTRCCAP